MTSREIAFWKYHGLGNDFVVIDERGAETSLQADHVRFLCARHRGIGADGVLAVRRHPEADVEMVVHNADGSRSPMCGNGIRCVARFMYDVGGIEPTQTRLRVAAGQGVYTCERVDDNLFRVAMGTARLEDPELPEGEGPRGDEVTIESDGRRFTGVRLSFGNPHLVLFEPEDPMWLARHHGPALERHPAFPNRVNVTFARQVRAEWGEDIWEAVVHERGVGITQACGSGACATGVAAVRTGRCGAGERIALRLPGGLLAIEVAEDGAVTMEGEAERVFEGRVGVPT